MYEVKQNKLKPQQREDANIKIINGVQNASISAQDAFNYYSGKGGLHGLKFNQFGSFHDYTDAKKAIESGQFFTPQQIVKLIVSAVEPEGSILDPCAGSGAFCNAVNAEDFTAVEIEPNAHSVFTYCFPQATAHRENIAYWDSKGLKYDYILTNPPFNLKWGKLKSQSFILRKSKDWLKAYGVFAAVVPMSYLQDEMMDKQDIQFINRNYTWIGQVALPKDAFKSTYGVNFETKVIFFQNLAAGSDTHAFSFCTWAAIKQRLSKARTLRRDNLVKVAQSVLKQSSYSFSNSRRDVQSGFNFQATKYLYEIKQHFGKKKYARALMLIKQYKEQERPEGVDPKEWAKVALTVKKVLRRLRIMAGHNLKKRKKKESRAACPVETKSFEQIKPELKQINFTDKFRFKNERGTHEFNDIQKQVTAKLLVKRYAILNAEQGTGKTPMSYAVMKYRRAKLNIILAPALAIKTTWTDHFNQNGESFALVRSPKDFDFTVNNWLITYTSLSSFSGEGPHLERHFYNYLFRQLDKVLSVNDSRSYATRITSKMPRGPESFKNKEAAQLIDDILFEIKNLNKEQRDLLRERILVYSNKDITKALRRRFAKQLRRQLRQISNNVQLIVDESDELSNRNSKRYRAARQAFCHVRYKLLTTGTTTRNNAAELYSQLELIYNNSNNLTDQCAQVYYEQKERGQDARIIKRENENKGKRFHPYLGLGQFKRCFSPQKTTVLGVKKYNQDLYNYEQYKAIIKQAGIIKTFEEVCGKKHDIEHVGLTGTVSERELQNVILNEFYRIVNLYYNDTGNTRKESALKIIRQLQLLIKSCSIPQAFKEYTGQGSSKLNRIVELVREKDEKIIIGCVTKEAARVYYKALSAGMRPLYYIDGSVSPLKRKKLLKQFESTANGIVVCTQQSLKSSINVPSCNVVIMESLQWNFPKMSQFFYRVIRFNSKLMTKVYFVTYSDSIEENLLGLVMAKEKINKAAQLEDNEVEEIFEKYGFDIGTFDRMMRKEYVKDADGNERVQIVWGKQSKVG